MASLGGAANPKRCCPTGNFTVQVTRVCELERSGPAADGEKLCDTAM
jgi:hypothetical protein